jgi:hypothetical protein
MHCVKLLGQRLMQRDFDRQVAEVQVRIGVLNGYTALGIPNTKAVEEIRLTKGEPCPSVHLLRVYLNVKPWQPVGGRNNPYNVKGLACPTPAIPAIEKIGEYRRLSNPKPPPEKGNAAPSAKGTAIGNYKEGNLRDQQCHKRRARSTGLFIWDRASGSFQTFANMRGALA